MTSLLPLSLNFPFRHKRPHSFPYKPFSCSPLPSRPFLCFSSPSNFDREEVRWLREEQRWLREEQRWLREEQRWLRERESLLQEISALKLQIQSLENRNPTQGASVSETIASIGALLQVLKEKNLIAESGTSAGEMVLKEKSEEVNEVVVVEQGITVLDRERRQDGDKMESKVLRKGSEGDDVRELQEALEKLGFYSGEEDMEYSSFSDGTERAVKTWQATIGSPENGIMTAELLERLYMEQRIQGSSSNSNADGKGASLTVPQKEETNGAVVASITEISEIQQKVVEEDGITEVEVSQQRVFLLGENRWEEPSRLIGRDKQVIANKTRDATTKCLTCRGEGRLMCTECDGTGEPNIEPQFLEWVDEGAKCPYCEGLGYITCDVCEGKMVT